MKIADEEKWNLAVHDCSNNTKFARDLNLAAKEGGWFGKSSYGSEFGCVPFEALIPSLENDEIQFDEEEEFDPLDMMF